MHSNTLQILKHPIQPIGLRVAAGTSPQNGFPAISFLAATGTLEAVNKQIKIHKALIEEHLSICLHITLQICSHNF